MDDWDYRRSILWGLGYSGHRNSTVVDVEAKKSRDHLDIGAESALGRQ